MLPAVNRRLSTHIVERDELTLAELVDLYVERPGAVRSPRTMRTLRERMKHPLERFGDTRLAELETWRSRSPDGAGHCRLDTRRR